MVQVDHDIGVVLMKARVIRVPVRTGATRCQIVSNDDSVQQLRSMLYQQDVCDVENPLISLETTWSLISTARSGFHL